MRGGIRPCLGVLSALKVCHSEMLTSGRGWCHSACRHLAREDGEGPGCWQPWQQGLATGAELRATRSAEVSPAGGWGPDVPAGCRGCPPTFPLVSQGGVFILYVKCLQCYNEQNGAAATSRARLLLKRSQARIQNGSATGRPKRSDVGGDHGGALPGWLGKARRLVPTEGTSRSRLESRNSACVRWCVIVVRRGSPAHQRCACPSALSAWAHAGASEEDSCATRVT